MQYELVRRGVRTCHSSLPLRSLAAEGSTAFAQLLPPVVGRVLADSASCALVNAFKRWLHLFRHSGQHDLSQVPCQRTKSNIGVNAVGQKRRQESSRVMAVAFPGASFHCPSHGRDGPRRWPARGVGATLSRIEVAVNVNTITTGPSTPSPWTTCCAIS